MDISDTELRAKCKDAAISVGPITNTTRNLYIKKLQKIGSQVQKSSQTQMTVFEKDLDKYSQSEIQDMEPDQILLLLKRCKIQVIPITKSNRKIAAKWIYYKINGLEDMEWEDFSTQTDLFPDSD